MPTWRNTTHKAHCLPNGITVEGYAEVETKEYFNPDLMGNFELMSEDPYVSPIIFSATESALSLQKEYEIPWNSREALSLYLTVSTGKGRIYFNSDETYPIYYDAAIQQSYDMHYFPRLYFHKMIIIPDTATTCSFVFAVEPF